MKKKILLILMTAIFAFTATSCKDDGTKPVPPVADCFVVEPVVVDDVTAKYLNDLFEYHADNAMVVYSAGHVSLLITNQAINSQEELENMKLTIEPVLFPQYDFSSYTENINIDFGQYILVGGSYIAIGSEGIKNIKMCKNISKQEYILTIVTISDSTDLPGNTQIRPLYYWRLYPKLEPEFTINFIGEVE
jgi:hypothetical protein